MSSAPRATRRLPPVLVGSLVLLWLGLNESLSLGDIVLGLVLAVAVAWASSYLRPLQPKLRRAYLAAALLVYVLRDIIRSNVGVARIVLGLVRDREVHAAFVNVPLTLQDPHGLAVLAGIITSTPGTVWVNHDIETGVLTIHVLDLREESAWIAWVKEPYERILREIFE